MTKNVILVGNGPSVLNKKNGHLIDEFDNVVRFSWFHIKGHEEYVGTKTDTWFTTVACPTRMKQKYKLVYEHSWEWSAEKDKNYKNLISAGHETKKTLREDLKEIQRYVKSEDYWTYSTGAIAIWILLRTYDKIIITGFDWWENNEKHHYGDNQRIGSIHEPDKEYRFIKMLLDENKIEFL